VFPVKYDLGYYIPEDGILHSHFRKSLKSLFSLFRVTKVAVSLVCEQFMMNILACLSRDSYLAIAFCCKRMEGSDDVICKE
jgi:hypothetical protein